MKKAFSMILSVLLVVMLLAGCGKSGDGTPTTAAGKGTDDTSASGEVEVITIKLAHNMDFVTIPDAVVDAGARLNERYAAEGKNIVVEFEKDYQRIDWTEYATNVIFADKSGEGPDIFTLDSEIIYDFYSAGVLSDVSELMSGDFVEGAYNSFMIDGKAWAMPFDLPVRAIYYNKTALNQIGWSDDEIAALPQKVANGEFTFEEFMALCQEVQEKGAVKYGMLHRPGYGNDFLDIMQTLGGTYHQDGKLVFDEQGITRLFQFLYDNANVTKITPPDLNQMGWETINTMVGDGSAFSYYGPVYSSLYVAGAVDKTPEELAEGVEYLMFPKSEYRTEPSVTAAPSGMAINPNTKHMDVCLDLLREVAKSPDLLARHGGEIFSLSSVAAANQESAITENPILKNIGYMADHAAAEPALDGMVTFTSEMHKQIVQLELGLIEPEKAVSDFKTQMELNFDSDSMIFK